MHFKFIDTVLCETIITESMPTLVINTASIFNVNIGIAHLAYKYLHGWS